MATADLLLHPVRLRIIQAMLGRDALTTRELGEQLPEIAPATLYRHVGALIDADVLTVVAERKVRGTTERTLRVREERTSVEADDPALDADALRGGFLAYLASLAAAFDGYIDGERGTLAEDLVGFRQVAVHATDDEWRTALEGIRAAVTPLLGRADPPASARRRLLATVSLPVD